MKTYKLTCLIAPDKEEQAQELQNRVTSFIQEQGGILESSERPSKKALAYPIRKKNYTFLASSVFQLGPSKLADLEKKLKAETQIIRHLILVKPLVEERPVRRKKAPEIVSKKSFLCPEKKEKIELKEIEKKLEEILGEN